MGSGWDDTNLKSFFCYLSFGIGVQESLSLLKQSYPILVAIIVIAYAETTIFNLMTFFTDYMFVRPILAAAYTNVIDAMSGIMGIVGAILVDVYFTDYGMLFFCSICYFLGLGLIASVTSQMLFEAAVFSTCQEHGYEYTDYHENDNDHKCLNALGYVLYYLAFALVVVGRSSLKTSIEALWEEKRGEKSIKKFLINGFVIIWNVITSATIIFLPTWPLLFGIGSLLMIPIIVFVFYYHREDFVKGRTEQRESPLKHVLRVLVAFILKCIICHVQDHNNVPYEKQNDGEHILPHTERFRFLDKAAMIKSSSGDPMEIEEERKRWRLCTVTEVEEVKRLLQIVPMCMTFLAYGMVKSVGNTFFLDQGNNMKQSLGGTTQSLNIFVTIIGISSSVTKRLYKLIISNTLSGSGRKYAPLIKIAVGMIFSTFCCTIAAWVETERRNHLPRNITLFWLTPQFLLFGAMDGLIHDGVENFFYHQLPYSMRRYSSAFTEGMIGGGTIFSIFLVWMTKEITESAGGPWFQNEVGNNITDSRMDRYFHLLSVVCFVILSAYAFVATKFPYQDPITYDEE